MRDVCFVCRKHYSYGAASGCENNVCPVRDFYEWQEDNGASDRESVKWCAASMAAIFFVGAAAWVILL
jgi:hypothetical protein